MATHTSTASFLHAVGKYPAKVKSGPDASVAAAAQTVKETVLSSFSGATGGDLVLSHVGRRGVKVGVNYKLTGSTATIRPTGPVGLIESASKAHEIGGARGRRGRRVLSFGGRFATGPISHPGTRAKRAWTKGVEAGLPPAKAAARVAFGKKLAG
jgi:hypothetical protein